MKLHIFLLISLIITSCTQKKSLFQKSYSGQTQGTFFNIKYFCGESRDFSNAIDSIFKVIDTPGHSIGHICFYFKEQNFLFCGDTIFSLGCGRLFEGSYEQMTESILKIRSLPDSTKIFCGHEYTESNAKFAEFLDPGDKALKKKILNIKKDRLESKPTIPAILEEEKKLNPFMKFDNQEYLDSIKIENISNAENFKKIRIMKDNF